MTNQTSPPQTGILASTSITAGSDGREQNHVEGIVVSTGLTAGAGEGGEGYQSQQHAEGIVVSTALTAGSGNEGLATNHGEGLVR
jgi:hypothetical protein